MDDENALSGQKQQHDASLWPGADASGHKLVENTEVRGGSGYA